MELCILYVALMPVHRAPQFDWIQQRLGDLNTGRISSNWVAGPRLAAMLYEFSLNK